MISLIPKPKLSTNELVNIKSFASDVYKYLPLWSGGAPSDSFAAGFQRYQTESLMSLMQRSACEFSELINSEDDGLSSDEDQSLLEQLKSCETLQQALEFLADFISEFFTKNFVEKIKLTKAENKKNKKTKEINQMLDHIGGGFDNQLALTLALTNMAALLLRKAKYSGKRFMNLFNRNLKRTILYLYQLARVPTPLGKKLFNMLGEKPRAYTRLYKFKEKHFALDAQGLLQLKQNLMNKWLKACFKYKIKYRWFSDRLNAPKFKQSVLLRGLEPAYCPAYKIKTPHHNNLALDTQLWTIRLIKKYINPLIENLRVKKLKSSLTDYLLPLCTRAKV